MTQIPKGMPNDPAMVRRMIDETRDFVDRGLRSTCETTFGLSQDTLLADPTLLAHFLEHANPALRADALVFTSMNIKVLATHFRHFLRRCTEIVRGSDPDVQVQLATLTAIGWLHIHQADPRALGELGRVALDPTLDIRLRTRAYASFVSSLRPGTIPGHIDAFLKLRSIEIDHEPLTDTEFGFVRKAMTLLSLA